MSNYILKARKTFTDTRRIFAGQIIAGILSLASVIVVAKYCGASIFGYSISTILVLSVGLDLVDFGTASWSGRELAGKRIKDTEFVEIMNYKTTQNLVFLPVGFLILFFYPSPDLSLILFGFYPALWVRNNYQQQFLIAKGKVGTAASIQILDRSCWLLVVPLTAVNASPWFAYIFPLIAGLLVLTLCGIKYQDFPLKFVHKKIEILDRQKQSIRHIGFFSVFTDLANLDVPIVAKISSAEIGGTYGLAQRFRAPLLLGFSSFSKKLIQVSATSDRLAISRLFRKESRFLAINYFVLLAGTILVYNFADEVFGSKFQDINSLLAISIIIAFPSSISVISSNFLMAIGLEKVVSNIYLGTIPLSLAIISFASIIGGVFAASFALLLCNSLTSFFFLYKGLHYWKLMLDSDGVDSGGISKAKSGTRNVFFLGGSTMRGYSKNGLRTSYYEMLTSILKIDTRIYSKDLITAGEAMDVIRYSLPFDTLVIQIGVADSLREFNPRIRGILHFLTGKFPGLVNNYLPSDHASVYDFWNSGKKRKFMKAIAYASNFYSHKTSFKCYRNQILEIQNFASFHGIRIIWLGSILGSQAIPSMEVKEKAKYCKLLFENLSEDRQYDSTFIDVEKLLCNFVSIEDPFHLTQEGHEKLKFLIFPHLT